MSRPQFDSEHILGIHEAGGEQQDYRLRQAELPPETFEQGDTVASTGAVNLRRTPGFVGKGDHDVVAQLAADTRLTLLSDQPATADGLTWWSVESLDHSLQGWLAQRAPNGVVLLEPAAAPPAGQFRPGDQAKTLNVVRLRRSPGYVEKPVNDVVMDVPAETVGTILCGPSTADDLTWWEVEFRSTQGQIVDGWLAESTPGGGALLAKVTDEQTPPPVAEEPFANGDLIQAASQIRVRRTPGVANKPADDVLGEFMPATTLNVVDGPLQVDGLTWRRVGGITPTGEAIGWVAEASADGLSLLRHAPPLPGTNIPDKATQSYLHSAFDGVFGISQLWGENAGYYGRYTYDGVPLKGHNGVDFLTPVGVELRAADAGSVLQTGYEAGGFGNYLVLGHPWGESLYAHLDSIAANVGQSVQRGTPVGKSGNSGGSQGPHLHFAIRINPYQRTDGWGGFSDPLPYMNPGDFVLPDYVLPAGETRSRAAQVATPAGDRRRAPARMAHETAAMQRP